VKHTAPRSSRPDHLVGSAPSSACDLSVPRVCRRRWPDLLRGGFDCALPARGWLRRSYPQGRESHRLTGAGVAAELVALAPDVILSTGSPSVAALQQATHTVPIVFVTVVDPVSSGFVDSLARPGGNITGFALYEYSISGKWLGLLKEIAPGITRAAVIRDPALTAGGGQLGVIQAVAPSVGAEVTPINVRDAGEIERAITTFARSPNGVLIVTGSTLAGVHRDLIVTLAQIARRLLRTLLRRWRWFDVLWAWTRRPIPGCRRIRGSYPQRREAGRPS